MTAPDTADRDGPAISVILATYNRPDVLAAAIRSVLAQEFEDWELLVVGDHCADETAATVAGFGDPRIRYINLRFNHGDQSGPNNVGLARARGRYVAFLNHDDLWFPDHLAGARDYLEASGADAVIARSATILLPNADGGVADDWSVALIGVGHRGRYDPLSTIGPASSLLIKAEAARRAGPWRPAAECYLASSQEWLHRMWRSGATIRTWPHLTVLMIASGARKGSYFMVSPEHAWFEPMLRSPADLRLLLLERVVEQPIGWKGRWARRLGPLFRAVAKMGPAPTEYIGRLIYGYSPGTFINQLRRNRGLENLPDREPDARQLRDRYQRESDGRHRPAERPGEVS